MDAVLHAAPVLFARGAESGRGEVQGLAAVFDAPDLGGERIRPGAFAKTITDWARRKLPIPMLAHHRQEMVVGGWNEVRETSAGLFVRGQIDMGTAEGARIFQSLQSRALSGLSIGFSIPSPEAIEKHKDGRTLMEIDLHEVSLVAVPAQPEARVTHVRCAPPATIREFEEHLREAGFSRSQAAGIAARGWHVFETVEGEGEADVDPGVVDFAQRTADQLMHFASQIRSK